jgi:predicted ATP-binding protein involved in virulence
LEEQTARVRQESEQRLVLEAARAEQERKLAELRRVQEEAVERARLDAEAGARRKVLEVEQALKEMTEETRLAENRLEAERLRIERETTLKKLDAELALLVHGQDALLAQRAQEAALARTRQERLAQLEMEETANRVQLELEEKQVGIARLQQEVENLVNEHSLKDRLIEKLPELAAHMPEVQELKVLQTGPSDGAFDTLTAFLARLLALAESLGLGQTKGPAAEADGSQSAAA